MAENTQNDGVKNFMSDIRYKLMLRAQAELEMTQSVVDGDNPWGCTAAKLTSWCDLARSDLSSVSIVMQNDMMLGGIDVPEVPDGWDFIVRAEDDLPPVLTRTNIDGYDPDTEVQESQTQDQSGVA